MRFRVYGVFFQIGDDGDDDDDDDGGGGGNGLFAVLMIECLDVDFSCLACNWL